MRSRTLRVKGLTTIRRKNSSNSDRELRQGDALKGADDVVRAFFGEEAFVISGAEVPVRALVIFIAIKSPHAALHNHAAHPVVPVIADVMETQVRPGVRTFKTDVIVKNQFGQPNNFRVRFRCDLAGGRRVIAQRAKAPFHVDDAPVIGRQFNFR